MTETAAAKAPAARRAKAKVEKAGPTEYVVLESYDVTVPNDEAQDAGDAVATVTAWREVDRITATGSEPSLLRKWADEKKRTGTFKLVPARSWKGGIRLFEQTSMASEPIA